MAYQDLSLPVDIPWKRLASSADMIDQTFGNRRFPPRWRSSVAVFYHEPDDLPETYCNRRVTYLKVVCTITGYQAGSEVGGSLPSDDPWHFERQQLGDRYHACHGAILQVGAFPGRHATKSVNLAAFPYIIDFEPKRRELYEAVTASSEILGRSTSALNVRKGATSADTTERAHKVGAEVSTSVGFVAGKITGETSNTHGTISQEENVRTTDDSREKRETYSASTSLTQMYELFTGYHLGSNRAVFFMLSRPHTTEEKDRFTFVNGPRRIEGIQEVFLVINRPRSNLELCVEALLETAHLAAPTVEPSPAAPGAPPVIYENKSYTISHSGRWQDSGGEPGQTKDFTTDVLTLQQGCELDESRGGGSFEVEDIDDPSIKYPVTIPPGFNVQFLAGTFWRSIHSISGGIAGNKATITITLKGLGGHGMFGSRGAERFNARITVYYRCPQQTQPAADQEPATEDEATLFLTSRSVSACIAPEQQERAAPDTVDTHVDMRRLLDPAARAELLDWITWNQLLDLDDAEGEDYRRKLEWLTEHDWEAFVGGLQDAISGGAVAVPRHWRSPEEWVSFEAALPVDPAMSEASTPAVQRVRAANELTSRIGERLTASFRSSGRHPDGAVDFWRSGIALTQMAKAYRGMQDDDPENFPIATLEVPQRERILDVFGGDTQRRVILLRPTVELARSLGITDLAAREVRARLMDPRLRPDYDRLQGLVDRHQAERLLRWGADRGDRSAAENLARLLGDRGKGRRRDRPDGGH
jgi:hypothetical protein